MSTATPCTNAFHFANLYCYSTYVIAFAKRCRLEPETFMRIKCRIKQVQLMNFIETLKMVNESSHCVTEITYAERHTYTMNPLFWADKCTQHVRDGVSRAHIGSFVLTCFKLKATRFSWHVNCNVTIPLTENHSFTPFEQSIRWAGW